VWVPGMERADGTSAPAKPPSATIVKMNPRDAAFALVTSIADGRMRETTTAGSLVATSIKLPPVVSPSTVNVRSVEVECAVTTEPRVSLAVS
jgi:hypothetical protein